MTDETTLADRYGAGVEKAGLSAEKLIVGSDVFRALNLMIDRYAVEVEAYEHRINLIISRAKEDTSPPRFATRVSYESEDGRYRENKEHLFSRCCLEDLLFSANAVRDALSKINEIQSFKLRLLNDYDFSKDDTTEQRHVFQALPTPGGSDDR